MSKRASRPCSECQRLRAELATLRARLTHVEEQLAAARKDSSSSSKPPSSDIVKPAKESTSHPAEHRHAGGQPGHPKHQRALVPPEQLTSPPHTYTIEICPTCGHGLQPCNNAPRVVQQIDIRAVPLSIEEHRSLAGWCPQCAKVHTAALPAVVERGGLVGPRLTALIAYLKGMCHASFATIRTYLRDVVAVKLSGGQLAKVIARVSQALEAGYEELYAHLADEGHLNVDETGHKDNGERWWTWCFRADLYTLFKIDPTRSGDVLIEVLGREFEGVLGCDYFSAYRRYMRECGVTIQFCLAHLIRDVKFLTTLPSPQDRAYGERLREALRELFAIIHRRAELSACVFQQRLRQARAQVVQAATTAVPATRAAEAMAKRFRTHGEAYFQFLTTPGIEPTNNLAEQAIRFVVIDRRITQGTRSATGRRWCERIWTVIATCAQQGRSVFEYLCQAVEASFAGKEAPSLLPQES